MTPLRDKAIDATAVLAMSGSLPVRHDVMVAVRDATIDALLVAGMLVAPRDDEARIERAASKFYERLRGVAIQYGAAPAWDDLSGVQRVPWIEDARQALAAADQEDTDAG